MPEKCSSCIHEESCAAWIRHGEMLYDDFEYSVEDCPHYRVYCKDCRFVEQWKSGLWCDCNEHYVQPNDFCSEGQRRDNE